MTNTANLKHFFDRSEQILSTIKQGNRMSLETSGSLKEHLEAMTDKYSSVLTEAPENPSQGDKWFDGKSTWTYNGTAWLPEFVTPNKSYFSFAATATANTATDLTQEIEMADNDLYKVTLDLVVTDCGLSTIFVVKEDGGNGVKLWNGSSWATSGTIAVNTLSGNLNSEPVLTFVPVAKGAGETHNKFKLQITSATSLSCRGTATIDHLLSGAITDGAVYDPTSGGGGGGSGDGFQPDRVIVIDTTLAQDVPGKAYSTFAAAYSYAESQQPVGGELGFCIQLPAGAFSQNITLAPWLTVRGNGTTLTTPGTLTSTCPFDVQNHRPEEYVAGGRRHLVGVGINSAIVAGPGMTYMLMDSCDFAPASFTSGSSTLFQYFIMTNCRTAMDTYNMGAAAIYAFSSVICGTFTTTVPDPLQSYGVGGWSLSNCYCPYFLLTNNSTSQLFVATNCSFAPASLSDTTTFSLTGPGPCSFVNCTIDDLNYTGPGRINFHHCNLVKSNEGSTGVWFNYTVVNDTPNSEHAMILNDCYGQIEGITYSGTGYVGLSIWNSRISIKGDPNPSASSKYIHYYIQQGSKVTLLGSVDTPLIFTSTETFRIEEHSYVVIEAFCTLAGTATAYPTCIVANSGTATVTAGTYVPPIIVY